MTTNEAITILEEVELIDDSIYQYNRKYLEALDMAIQSLEQTEKVTPIVRGRWLNVSKTIRDDYLGDVNYAECSVCHSIRVADYFCSCCGAGMRKMEELEKT